MVACVLCVLGRCVFLFFVRFWVNLLCCSRYLWKLYDSFSRCSRSIYVSVSLRKLDILVYGLELVASLRHLFCSVCRQCRAVSLTPHHTGAAYVIIGRIIVLYILVLFSTLSLLLLVINGWSVLSAASALALVFLRCCLKFSLESRWTPRYLTVGCGSIFSPLTLSLVIILLFVNFLVNMIDIDEPFTVVFFYFVHVNLDLFVGDICVVGSRVDRCVIS
jgi:hypothetical protein